MKTPQEIKEFEEMCMRLEKEPCPHQLSYYGVPFTRPIKSMFTEEQFNKFFKDYVLNDLLGAVHWSVVKHGEDEGAMRKSGGSWQMIGEETGDSKMRWKWPKFCNLEECIKGMRDSRWRRGYYGATDGMFKI